MASRSHHQLNDSMTKRFQRRLVSYSALGIVGIGIVVAAASFIPFLDQLRQDRKEHLLRTAETKAIAIDQFLLRTQEIAIQVTSRTRIRQELEAYNRGEISRNELVDFSASKLLEALNHSEEIVAIARYDGIGEQVVQVGLPVTTDLWILPPHPTTDVTVSDPFLHTDGNIYLLAQAPIIAPTSQNYVGTDVVMFRITELQAILSDRRALGETGQIFLGTYTDTTPYLFNLSSQPTDTSSATVLSQGLHPVIVEGHNHLFLDHHPDIVSVFVPIPEAGWGLLVTEDLSELYAPMKAKLLQLGWVVLLLSGLQTLLIFVMLRPLAGQVLIQTDELNTMTHQLQAACEQSPAVIIITDVNGNIEYVNPKFEELTGYSAAEVFGKNPRILKSDYTSGEEYQDLWQTIMAGKCWHGQFYNRKKNGEFFWESASISPIKNDLGEVTHFVAVKEDITQQKAQEALLTYQANYDGLTGLPNRMLALDRLQQALVKADRDRQQVALIFLDLDHFKEINDTLGHESGDRLLTLTAQRLQSCLRASDTVARLGGDEFLLILPGLENLHNVEVVVSKILDTISAPLVLNTEEITVSVSAGIAIYPDDSTNIHELRQYADAAMYVAKREGRNTFRFFTQSMNRTFQDRLRVENRLRHAVEHHEFYLVYQPLFDLTSGRVLGAEALLRWENPELSYMLPEHFIPIAEETGLINPLGLWVMQQACHDAKRWHQMGLSLRVSVNLSPQQFRNPLLAETFSEVAQRNHFDPRFLEIEITERLLLEDIPGAIQMIDQLHRLGFHLVIDDFGTGYSSLNYLHKYPFKALKIDRSFVMDLPENQESMSLVRATLAIAKEFNIKTIAEGIETSKQLAFLQQEGCHIGQGYYFSKPLPLSDFETFIQHINHLQPERKPRQQSPLSDTKMP